MKKFALVVGISSYADPEITDLAFAARDAEEIGDVLVKACGFDEVRTLASGGPREPDHVNVVDALQSLAPLLSPDDLFLFYFAGHGIETRTGAHLLTSNSRIRMPELASVSKEVLSDCLSRIECADRVLILDACRNDPCKGMGDQDNLLTSGFSRDIMAVAETAVEGVIPTTCVLFSCRPGQRAYEWPDMRHGAFSHYLLEGLRGAAADAGGRITVQALGRYVEAQVPRWAKKTGKPRPQTPWGEHKGSWREILLAIRVAPAPASPAIVTSPPRRKPYPVLLDMQQLMSAASYAVAMVASTDGKQLLTLHANRTAHLWSIPNLGQHLVISPYRADEYLTAAAIRPTRSGWELLVGLCNGFETWLLNGDGMPRFSRWTPFENLVDMQMSTGGLLVLLVSSSGQAEVRRSDVNDLVGTFACREHLTRGAFCKGDHSLVAGSESGKVLLWDMATGRLVRTRDDHGGKPISALCGLQSGQLYLSVAEDGGLTVCRSATGEPIKVAALGQSALCAFYAADDDIIAVGLQENGQAKHHAVAALDVSLAERWRIQLPDSPGALTAVGPDVLAVACHDHRIALYRVHDSKLMATLVAFGAKDWMVMSADGRIMGAGYDSFLTAAGPQSTRLMPDHFTFDQLLNTERLNDHGR